jgi:hypothetical protein
MRLVARRLAWSTAKGKNFDLQGRILVESVTRVVIQMFELIDLYVV